MPSRRSHERTWDDRRISSLGFTAAPDVDALVRELRSRAGPEPEVLIRSNRALRAASLVINQRSFGWTLQLSVGPGALVQAVALAVGAALLAGVYPASRMAQMIPASALRDK